jgi:hypothetical protein
MNDSKKMNIFHKIDWRWVGISYCFYVVFHLLPTYLISWISFQDSSAFYGAWIWIVFGTFIISIYIAYRSEGVTIIEPTLASFCYVLTIAFSLPRILAPTQISTERFIYLLLAGFAGVLLFTFIGAYIGERIQQIKERKQGEM